MPRKIQNSQGYKDICSRPRQAHILGLASRTGTIIHPTLPTPIRDTPDRFARKASLALCSRGCGKASLSPGVPRFLPQQRPAGNHRSHLWTGKGSLTSSTSGWFSAKGSKGRKRNSAGPFFSSLFSNRLFPPCGLSQRTKVSWFSKAHRQIFSAV